MPMEENISRNGRNTAPGRNPDAGLLHKHAGVGGTVWWAALRSGTLQGWPGGIAQGSWRAGGSTQRPRSPPGKCLAGSNLSWGPPESRLLNREGVGFRNSSRKQSRHCSVPGPTLLPGVPRTLPESEAFLLQTCSCTKS